MPYTAQGLPFAGRSPISRHCSYQAAMSAERTRGAKAARYRAWLREVGSATDHQAAEHFGWPRSSICSIRNGLGDQVIALGRTDGPYGKAVTVWAVRETVRG